MSPTLSWSLLGWLVLNALLLSAGQILFKLAADQGHALKPWWMQLATNPLFLSALAVYAVATGLWVWILRQTPLQLAYPFVALAYLFVPLAAHFLLNEPLRWQSLAGAAVIGLGIWISVSGR